MDLNVKSAQDFSHKPVRRQAKTSGKECFEHDQFAFRLGDLIRPRDASDSAAKVPSCCISCTRTEDIRDTPKSTISPARNSSAATVLSVSSDDMSAGGVAAAEEEEVGIATYRRRRRTVCFTRARSPANKNKEGRRAARRWKRRLGFTQSAALRETRNPTVRRQSTVMSKTPAEPLRARAASPPSSDVFGTR
jgi:hypothetical protein